MSVTNFGPTCWEAAIYNLAEGFIVCERKGGIVAIFEGVNDAWEYQVTRPDVNVHFPNGEFLAADSIVGAPEFLEIAMKLAINEYPEEVDIGDYSTPFDYLDRNGPVV